MTNDDQSLVQSALRFASVRKRNGMTQAEFAEKLGISYRTIQNCEAGKQAITSHVLRKLYFKFGTSSDWIISGPEFAPEQGNRYAMATAMASKTYETWETLVSSAPRPVAIDTKSILFNLFLDQAIHDGKVPLEQMQRTAASLIERGIDIGPLPSRHKPLAVTACVPVSDEINTDRSG